MNIYTQIKNANTHNMDKKALSMNMDSGEITNITYSNMFSKVEKTSSDFLQLGLVPGDKVAIIAENSPEWVITYLALAKINCTSVLIDASLSQIETYQLLATSDVVLAVISPKILEKMDFQSKDLALANIYDIKTPFEGYSSFLKKTEQALGNRDETIANIIFSSGTTRKAAGIMHTHESMLRSTEMCLNEINMRKDEERFLSLIPCSHIYGIVCTLIGPLLIGAEIRFVETITRNGILAIFAEYKPTIFPAVPKMLELFSSQIKRKISSDKKTKTLFDIFFPICYFLRKHFDINLGKTLFKSVHDGFGGALDIICSAGAPLDKETADFYFGCGLNVLITYGATETNIPTLGNLRHNITTNTCGQPYPDVSVKLSDSGEILIKSPYMMKGYYNDAESTAAAFDDGWFLTGDIAVVDEKGFYHITGRVKDSIVLSTGKKVAPDSIEAFYSNIAGVLEFVICGVPTVYGGSDEVHAFIVAEQAEIHDSIKKAIHEIGTTLSASMKIMRIHFVESIPRTSLQKPKRYLLRASLTA